MAQEPSFPSGEPVTVMCFAFNNPLSINGPFGNFQLWINGSQVEGQMTISLLFGQGSTTTLNLTGNLSGMTPIVCTLKGSGVLVTPLSDQPAQTVNVAINGSFASDWSTGEINIPGFFGNLQVQAKDCTTA